MGLVNKSLIFVLLSGFWGRGQAAAQVIASPSTVDQSLDVGGTVTVPVTLANLGSEPVDVTLRGRMTSRAVGHGRLFALPAWTGGTQELVEVDPRTGESIRSVNVGGSEDPLWRNYTRGQIAFDGEAVYLATLTSKFVRASVEDGSILDRLDIRPFVTSSIFGGLAYGDGALYSAQWEGRVLTYDLETQERGEIPLPRAEVSAALAYGGLRGTLFVAYSDGAGTQVNEIRRTTGEVVNTFDVNVPLAAIAYSQARDVLYLQNGVNKIYVLDPDTGREVGDVLDRISAPGIAADGSEEPLYLDLTPDTLSLGANASVQVSLAFDAGLLLEGTAEAVVEVRSVGTTLATVPVTLRVDGEPRLALDAASVSFGDVIVGQTVRDSVKVENTGTAPMSVTLSVDEGLGFVVSPASVEVAPNESVMATVSFAPVSAGAVSSALTLVTDDPAAPTASIELRATALAPPHIVVAPVSLAPSAEARSTTTRGILLSNEGDSVLDYTLHAETEDLANPTLFAVTYGNRIVRLDPSTLQQRGGFATSRTGIGGRADALASDGTFLYYVPYNGDVRVHVYDPATGIVARYYELPPGTGSVRGMTIEGGKVYVAGEISDRDVRQLAGDFSAVERRLRLPDGYLFEGDLTSAEGTLYLMVQGPSGGEVLSMDAETGQTTGSFLRPQGAVGGIAYVDGALYIGRGSNGAVVVDPATGAVLDELPPSGTFTPRTYAVIPGYDGHVTVSAPGGTIEGGASTAITATFDATDLTAGTYSGSLVFSSNDPSTPELRVPFELTVTGTPEIEVGATALAFGDVYRGGESWRRFEVRNLGTATLTATLAGPPSVTASPAALTLAPGEKQTVVVTYAPTAVVDLAAALRISSNDLEAPAIDVALSGAALAAPHAIVKAAAPYAPSVGAGATTTLTVSIQNDGEAPLRYAVVGRPDDAARPMLLVLEPGHRTAIWKDAITGADLGTLDLPEEGTPRGLAVSPDSVFYLTEYSGNFYGLGKKLWVLDRATGAVMRQRDYGVSPFIGLAYDDGALYFVSLWDMYGWVSRLDLTTGAQTEVPNPRRGELFGWGGLAVDHDILYVSLRDGPAGVQGLYRVDATTGGVLGMVPETSVYSHLAYADGRLFGARGGSFRPINPLTGARAAGPVGPASIVAGDGATLAWVSPAYGTVAPGETAEIEVEVSAEELGLGVYEGTLAVVTDDPETLDSAYPITLEVREATGEASAPKIDAFSVGVPYPNPTGGRATIDVDLPAAASVRIEVFDAAGRLVQRASLGEQGPGRHHITLDGSDFPVGVYAVQVKADADMAVRRFLVVR